MGMQCGSGCRKCWRGDDAGMIREEGKQLLKLLMIGKEGRVTPYRSFPKNYTPLAIEKGAHLSAHGNEYIGIDQSHRLLPLLLLLSNNLFPVLK